MTDMLNNSPIECFPIPTMIDMSLSKLKTSRIFNLGDALPYKTPFYDYSENFLIFDYRHEMDLWVYIVEKGICKYALPIEFFPNDYPIALVLNKDGIPLNVRTADDMILIAEEYFQAKEAYGKYVSKLMKQNGITKENKHRKMFQAVIKQIELIAFNKTMKLFQETWFNQNLENSIKSNIVGVLYDLVLNNTCTPTQAQSLFELYCLEQELEVQQEVEIYLSWADLHNLDITMNDLRFLLENSSVY